MKGLGWLMATALAIGLLMPGAALASPAVGPSVDLNTATVEELCTLPGIGPKKAEAIVELRKHRPFSRVTQLLEVRGIGKKTLDRLKARVRLTVVPAVGAGSAKAPALVVPAAVMPAVSPLVLAPP